MNNGCEVLAPVSKGFTLLELMLAMAMFSVTAVVFLGVAHQHVNTVEHVQNRMLASMVAKNKLVEVRVYNPWPALGKKEEFQEMAGMKWWSVTTVGKGPEKGSRRIDVQVGIETEDMFEDKRALFSLASVVTDPSPPVKASGQGSRNE